MKEIEELREMIGWLRIQIGPQNADRIDALFNRLSAKVESLKE